MIFDTHAHYDDEQFDIDREELLASMKEGGKEAENEAERLDEKEQGVKTGVGAIVNISAASDSCETVVAMTETYQSDIYPEMYAAVGVHPDHAGELTEERFAQIESLLAHEKVVAVGEIGLDYYWDKADHAVQKEWFIRQLDLAREHGLPVVIHSRDAAADTMEIMKEHGQDLGGVIHCYSYSREQAEEYVKMGYYIGVGGVVTFKNSRKLKEVVEAIPLTSIVLETDCPYLSPVPYRGKRNSSLNLIYVAQEIASLKGITYEEVVAQTERNARELYHV